MKKTLRNYLCGFLSALLIIAFVVPSFAETTTRQISAIYSGIVIYINGDKFEPKDINGNPVQPFIVDGTTYLPIRAIAQAAGYDVDYDASIPAVLLTSSTDITPTPSTAPTPTPAVFDTALRSNLISRLNACLKVANVAYNGLQTQYKGYLSRGMARSSNAQVIAASQASVSTDISSMRSLMTSIQAATTNEQLAQYQTQVEYYESVY